MNHIKYTEMISAADIQNKIKELGSEISEKFKGEKLIAVCVLRGSFIFFADLIRQISCDVQCEFFGVSSYHGSTNSSGEVKLTLDLSTPIEGANVLLIEDIVDTGLTMNYLKQTLLGRKPKTLTTVSLLEKPDALKVPCKIDFVGFRIPNDFVIGYGLDYQGYYRQLPFIARVESLN